MSETELSNEQYNSCNANDTSSKDSIYESVTEFNGFKCLHLNIHTLLRNLDEISLIIKDLDLDCISLNETRLCSSIPDSEIYIQGYSVFKNDRCHNNGGVAIYIRDNLMAVQLQFEPTSESIWIKLKISNHSIIIASIYRPPSSNVHYYECILEDIGKAYSTGSELILMGDFNYDVFSDKSFVIDKIRHISSFFALEQIISEPSGVVETSSTLIDLIFVSNSLKVISSEVINISLSDHCAVFAIIDLKVKNRFIKTSRCRPYKHFNRDNFIYDLCYSDELNSVLYHDDVFVAWDIFKCEYLHIS